MKLYIMRHGPAEDTSRTGRDADRALTPSGRDRVRDVARALVEADEAPHSILSSPLVRALQTAEIVAAVTKLEDRGESVSTVTEMAPGGDADGLVRVVARKKQKRVMLVGHEPDLSALVFLLTQHRIEMQKALVVGISIATGDEPNAKMTSRLRFVLDPKSLAWTSSP